MGAVLAARPKNLIKIVRVEILRYKVIKECAHPNALCKSPYRIIGDQKNKILPAEAGELHQERHDF